MKKNKHIEWLTPDQFFEIYGIKHKTQAKKRMAMIKDEDGNKMPNPDRLPYSKWGKFVRYDRAEIDKFFSKHKVSIL